jgi:hypothetical protein
MEIKCIYYFIFDEGILSYTRFTHMFMIPKLCASSEMFLCADYETRSVLLVNKLQDQTLCLATRRRDFLIEFGSFL